MPQVRVVFFGSSDSVFSDRHYRVLETAGAEIVAVVDTPPARRASTNQARAGAGSFASRAQERGIPVLEPADPNAPEVVGTLRALSPDLFLAVGYLLLLKAPLLAVPRVIAANFHASLLPAYRGKHPVFWALRHGERRSGLTVHEMGPGLDTGDIIFQTRVHIRASDSVRSLYERIMARSVEMIPRLIACVSAGRVPRRQQPARGASYFGATTDDDFRLDLTRDAKSLARWVEISPGQCFIQEAGKRLFVDEAVAAHSPRAARAAMAAAAAGGRALETGRGVLVLSRVHE
jgi:methionyl-tRNA formyltransferase